MNTDVRSATSLFHIEVSRIGITLQLDSGGARLQAFYSLVLISCFRQNVSGFLSVSAARTDNQGHRHYTDVPDIYFTWLWRFENRFEHFILILEIFGLVP